MLACTIMSEVRKIKRRVLAGTGRGSKLGYPTANLELYPDDDIKKGVWATVINVDDQDYFSATFVGTPVSFDEEQEKIEAFIFDYEGDLYDKEVELSFVKWLRPVEKFADESELIEQIKQDCQQAKFAISIYLESTSDFPGVEI